MPVSFYTSTQKDEPVQLGLVEKARFKDFDPSLRTLLEKGILTQDMDSVEVSLYSTNTTYVVPHKGISWDLYKQIYERVPLVANAINNTADFAIQSGFEIEGSEFSRNAIDSFFDKYNFELILLNIIKQMQIYGNAYLEVIKSGNTVTDIKLLPVKQMYVVVAKGENDGQVVGYKQILNNKAIDFNKDEIIHFKWNEVGNAFYGMSDIRPILGTLTKFLNWQDDLGQILHRFAAPFYHWKLGTDDFPATQTQLDNFKSTLEDRLPGEDIISSTAVAHEVVGSGGKMMQVDGLVKNLENQLIGGLRIPEIFARGGESSNKATADIELQAFDRKVKAIQKIVGFLLEDFLFPHLTKGKPKIVWNEFSTEGELSRAKRLLTLTQSDIPLQVGLKMVGWGSWTTEVSKTMESEEEENQEIIDKINKDLTDDSKDDEKNKEVVNNIKKSLESDAIQDEEHKNQEIIDNIKKSLINK